MSMTDTYTPAQVQDVEDESSSTGSSRRRLYAAGGVAALLGLGAGLYFMFGNSAPTDDSQFRLSTPTSSAAPSAGAVVSSPKPAVSAVAKVGTRDPFKALKPGAVETAVAVADTTGSTASSGTTSDPSAPAVVAVATPTAAPASSVTLTVSAIDPVAQTVVVDVDGKKYATGVGKTFAQSFSVYSVFNAQCVGILYGSQSTPVCLAAPVSVTP